MAQLLCHLWGDYILQSDWMAQNKTKAWWPAMVHAALYSFTFLFLKPSPTAILVIANSHLLIDRFSLAKYVVWAKNWIGPNRSWLRSTSKSNDYWESDPVTFAPEYQYITTTPNPPFSVCAKTGYPPSRPDWMAVWLLIIADNTLHLTINFLALKFAGGSR